MGGWIDKKNVQTVYEIEMFNLEREKFEKKFYFRNLNATILYR